MKSNNKVQVIVFAIIAGVCIIFCNSSWAQRIRHVRPHTIYPVPGPPNQYMKEAFFYKWSSKEVIKAFKDHDLEVVDVKKPGFIMGSPGARENTIFLIPSFGNDIGSLVSSYSSEDVLKESIKYYSTMNKDAESPVWRIFKKDNILVLISGRVPEEKAREYQEVLSKMK